MSTQFERDAVQGVFRRNLRRPKAKRQRCQQKRLWDCNTLGVSYSLRVRHRYVTVAMNEKPIGTWELSHCTKCGILVYEDMPF